jgi:hypothetical protein
MPNIRTIDMLLIDDIFEMGGGFVLNFSDRTFANFFSEELNINIDDPQYSKNGGSKAKRLRYFLQVADNSIVIKTLNALWEYREVIRKRAGQAEKLESPHETLRAIIAKLSRPIVAAPATSGAPTSETDSAVFSALQADLMKLSDLEAHPRGFAFEKFLRQLFVRHLRLGGA